MGEPQNLLIATVGAGFPNVFSLYGTHHAGTIVRAMTCMLLEMTGWFGWHAHADRP